MKVQDHLDQTLEATADFTLVAFGDLTTGMILNWSSRTQCPREVMDLLGETAAASFSLLDRAGVPPGADPAQFGAELLHVTETGTEVFARSPAGTEDVVCAVGKQGAPIAPLLDVAAGLSRKIADMP